MGLSCVPLHFRDEFVLIRGARLEPAVAMEHPVRHLEAKLGICL